MKIIKLKYWHNLLGKHIGNIKFCDLISLHNKINLISFHGDLQK